MNDKTAQALPGLFARNERLVCEFETHLGKIGMEKGLLRKSNRDADEEAEYRNFVSLSVEKLRQSGFDNRRALNIIKFHCERMTAAGSPRAVVDREFPFWRPLPA